MKQHSKNRIDLLEEYIRNSSEKTTPNLINANSFYSYRHANRLFKSVNGESINTFSNKIRLQLAADYLKYTSKNIAAIALDIDYKSSAEFSKAFKKQYSLTPSDFRKKYSVNQLLENHEKPKFSIAYLDTHEVCIFKVTMPSTITFEGFYTHINTAFEKMNYPEAEPSGYRISQGYQNSFN